MTAPPTGKKAFRAAFLHCLDDPGADARASAIEHVDDGVLLIEDGVITALQPAARAWSSLGDDVERHDLRGALIVPGFIDGHVHYPQLEMIAAPGGQLLDWLQRYTYPTEAKYADAEYAEHAAEFFVEEMLRRGTTSAAVFATVHAHSVDAIFRAAERRRLCLISGKVLMDRHCPEDLRDTPESGEADSRALIERWHGRGRLRYAITPRFAATSSPAQLEAAGRLARTFPDVYVHSHVAENEAELRWIAELFPDDRSYLAVYERYGLLRERALYAHCIHLDAVDRRSMGAAGAAAVFCPSSNLFLGSGLFDLAAADEAGMRVALGTDVGAGTDLGMLRTMGDAYRVLQLRGQALAPLRALYLATLGAARALRLDRHIGNFQPGREADFVVLDTRATPLLARRNEDGADAAEQVFTTSIIGDDRVVSSTWVLGERVWARDAA